MSTLTVTSALAAKAALVTAIRARCVGANAAVQVCYGFPEDLSSLDIIAVMSISNGQTQVRLDSHARRQESYDVDVICSSAAGTSDQQTVSERAKELMHLVALAVADNPNMGGAVNNAEIKGGFEILEPDPRALDQYRRVAEAHFAVNCESHDYA